jgi:hypothetical protein
MAYIEIGHDRLLPDFYQCLIHVHLPISFDVTYNLS